MIQKKKKRTEWVYNPEKADYEWKEVETDKYVFDETDNIELASYLNFNIYRLLMTK
ncbi:MAG: hypothetical protein K5842_06995 [Bacteroidales bacterium]|nr:hypothetical protein [Bacteroidales bacterium]